MRATVGRRLALPLVGLLLLSVAGSAAAAETREYPKWSKIEFSFEGPNSQGRGEPNPFAIVVDVVFTSPPGAEFRVPGFYDGNGRGGLDGNLSKVRFSADQAGEWTSYRTVSSHK